MRKSTPTGTILIEELIQTVTSEFGRVEYTTGDYDYTDDDVAKKPQWAGYWTTDSSVTLYFAYHDNIPDVYPEIPDESQPSSDPDDEDRTDGYHYKIQKYYNGKWVKVYETNSNFSYHLESKITGLRPYTKYKFRAIFYNYNNGKKARTKTITVRTSPKQTSIISASSSNDSAVLKWKKVNCEGYYIERYSYENEAYFRIKRINGKEKNKATITGLKPDNKYKFRVVPYGKIGSSKFPEGHDNGGMLMKKNFAKPSKALVVRTKK